MIDAEELAQKLYEEFAVSHDRNGVEVDTWEDLDPVAQEAWRDVARAAARLAGGDREE